MTAKVNTMNTWCILVPDDDFNNFWGTASLSLSLYISRTRTRTHVARACTHTHTEACLKTLKTQRSSQQEMPSCHILKKENTNSQNIKTETLVIHCTVWEVYNTILTRLIHVYIYILHPKTSVCRDCTIALKILISFIETSILWSYKIGYIDLI